MSAPDPLAPDATGVRAHHARITQAGFRSPAVLVAALVVATLLPVGATTPWVRDVLQVRPLDVALAAYGFIGIHVACYLAYRLAGVTSWAYRTFNMLENAWTVLGSLFLVYASGDASSFFWVCYLAVVVQSAGSAVNTRFNIALFCGGPVIVAALDVALRDDVAGAVLTLGFGAVAVVAYLSANRATMRMLDAQEEREALQQRLADVQVREERARIARDLHDSLGAELTALLYRARLLHAESPDGAAREELASFIDRMRQGTEELRNVVWVLRQEGQRWEDLVSLLRTRLQELCGDAAVLQLVDDGAPDAVLPGELRLHVVRILQEAVRNAVRHSRARSVRVRLRLQQELLIVVEDDGCGIPPEVLRDSRGGLHNMRVRAESTGGCIEFVSGQGGTSIKVRWPHPASAVVRSASA